MKILGRAIALILIAAVVIFAAQNSAVQDLTFLIWHVRVSSALAALVPFALGLVIGYTTGRAR